MSALSDRIDEYERKTLDSKRLFAEARNYLPGGDTREVTYFDPYPTFVEEASGCTLTTADGEMLLDFLNNYTQSVLGHAPPAVVRAVTERFARGNGFAAPTNEATELAKRIVERTPSVESVRFTNSGTEATMNAIRAAIAHTDSDHVLKLDGAYHGTHDTVLVAVDSSGFSTSRFGRYFDYKHGQEEKYRKWVKAHLCCGVKTNIVTAVSLTEGKAGDSPEFGPLVERTAEVFGIEEVSADKAYSSRGNLGIVDRLGGEAYIPFKDNATGRAKGSPAWKKMYHKFQMETKEFRQHYHKRSNVETVFHMLKTKFGDSVNAKKECSQFNEVLLKILCHNVVVVIHELRESNIDPGFLADDLDTASELIS